MWRWKTCIIYLYIDTYYIFFRTLTGCNAACTAQKCKKTWVNATSFWTNDSWNAGGHTVGEGAALIFSSEGERDAHPPAGSAPGRPLWATMTRWEDEDLHHSLMNLWCWKWKQPLARSSGACGAAPALEMGGKTGLKQKNAKDFVITGTQRKWKSLSSCLRCACAEGGLSTFIMQRELGCEEDYRQK